MPQNGAERSPFTLKMVSRRLRCFKNMGGFTAFKIVFLDFFFDQNGVCRESHQYKRFLESRYLCQYPKAKSEIDNRQLHYQRSVIHWQMSQY